MLTYEEEQKIKQFLSSIVSQYAGKVNNSDASYGVWFAGRRSPIGVDAENASEAISKARKKKKRGGNTARARRLKPNEIRTASKGWLRTGFKGEPAGYRKSFRGQGPAPKRDELDTSPGIIQEFHNDVIVKNGEWYEVWNEDKTKRLGRYKNRGEAIKRLRQIEYFKTHQDDGEEIKEFTISAKLLDSIGDYLENASEITEAVLTEAFKELTGD